MRTSGRAGGREVGKREEEAGGAKGKRAQNPICRLVRESICSRPRENHAVVRNENFVSRTPASWGSTKIGDDDDDESDGRASFGFFFVGPAARNFSRGLGKGKGQRQQQHQRCRRRRRRRGWREEKPRIGQDAVVVRLARLHRVIDTTMVSAVSASSYSISASIVRRRSTRSVPARGG